MPPQELQVSPIPSRVKRFVEPLSRNVGFQTATRFPGELAEQTARTGMDIAQGIVRAPFRIAKTLGSDLPRQVQQKNFSRWTAPLLGEIKGYGQQFAEETAGHSDEIGDLGVLSSAIKNVSEGVLDVSMLASLANHIASKYATRTPKVAPESVAPTGPANAKNLEQTKVAIFGGEGKTSSFAGFEDEVGKSVGNRAAYAKGRLDDVAMKLGELNPTLEQIYRKSVKPDATTVESTMKSVLEPAKKLLSAYEGGKLTPGVLGALSKAFGGMKPETAEAQSPNITVPNNEITDAYYRASEALSNGPIAPKYKQNRGDLTLDRAKMEKDYHLKPGNYVDFTDYGPELYNHPLVREAIQHGANSIGERPIILEPAIAARYKEILDNVNGGKLTGSSFKRKQMQDALNAEFSHERSVEKYLHDKYGYDKFAFLDPVDMYFRGGSYPTYKVSPEGIFSITSPQGGSSWTMGLNAHAYGGAE